MSQRKRDHGPAGTGVWNAIPQTDLFMRLLRHAESRDFQCNRVRVVKRCAEFPKTIPNSSRSRSLRAQGVRIIWVNPRAIGAETALLVAAEVNEADRVECNLILGLVRAERRNSYKGVNAGCLDTRDGNWIPSLFARKRLGLSTQVGIAPLDMILIQQELFVADEHDGTTDNHEIWIFGYAYRVGAG